MKVTERFTKRVENYVKYRPGYPPEVFEFLRDEYGLSENSVIADIGAGTGISAKYFLERGCKVFGIEPNDAMREAAEDFLRNFPKFESVKGTAEATNLGDESVDFVVAATAFHWFDKLKSRDEFRRILRQTGYIVLMWNVRRLVSNSLTEDYENLLREFGTDYKEINCEKFSGETLCELFGGNFRQVTFLNAQMFDFEGLKGRVLSSSYIPLEGEQHYEEMLIRLNDIFRRCEKDGRVEILYNTEVFTGKI